MKLLTINGIMRQSSVTETVKNIQPLRQFTRSKHLLASLYISRQRCSRVSEMESESSFESFDLESESSPESLGSAGVESESSYESLGDESESSPESLTTSPSRV